MLTLILGTESLTKYETARIEKRMCMEIKRLTKNQIDHDQSLKIWGDMTQKLHLADKNDLAFMVVDIKREPTKGQIQTISWPKELTLDNHVFNKIDSSEPTQWNRCRLDTMKISNDLWVRAQLDNDQFMTGIIVKKAAALDEINVSLRRSFKILIPIYLFCSVLVAWVLTRFVTQPLYTITKAMNKIDKNELHLRLNLDHEYIEFQEFISSYNEMLERLERSFHQASRFATNAAHELRTPLTILQGKLEKALNHSTNSIAQQELSQMLDEVTRLAHITKRLLFLAQAESGNLILERSKFDISVMLEELTGDMEMLAENKHIHLRSPKNILINADEVLIRQLLTNLLSNAMKYAVKGTVIDLLVNVDEHNFELRITNICSPIDLNERSRFFDSFYRGDPARTRHIDGTGLGLNVALEIARAHKGLLRLEESSADVVQLHLTLPVRTTIN
jgi:signal transduction histidine kinase